MARAPGHAPLLRVQPQGGPGRQRRIRCEAEGARGAWMSRRAYTRDENLANRLRIFRKLVQRRAAIQRMARIRDIFTAHRLFQLCRALCQVTGLNAARGDDLNA